MHVFPVNGQRYVEPLDVALDIRLGGMAAIGLDRLVDMPAGPNRKRLHPLWDGGG
jgi:hypothetical protein